MGCTKRWVPPRDGHQAMYHTSEVGGRREGLRCDVGVRGGRGRIFLFLDEGGGEEEGKTLGSQEVDEGCMS